MNMGHLPLALMVGFAAAAATIAGGTLALRFRSKLGALFGFSSGAVIGVALLDLLPEALDLGGPLGSHFAVTTAVAGGFIAYFAMDQATELLFGAQGGHRGHLGPGSLTIHSLLDGLAIGFAFQVSATTGFIVAVAILAHDSLDGANTAALSIAGGGSELSTQRWLLADALAPLLGIGAAHLLTVADSVLSILLAVFVGGFLYIGASELLPRSRDGGATLAKAATTGLGLAFIYVIVRLSTR
jgi:ZIP family zinc transporter